MKNTFVLILISSVLIFSGCRQTGKTQNESLLEQNMDLAVSHYKNMMQTLPEGRFPRSYENDEFTTSNSGWWCSGFYPGTLLYLHETTKDEALLQEAYRMLELLEKEQYNTSTHDLGFMMFCSFGNANRVAPKPAFNEILVNSAKSLSTRYSEEVGCIRSWDSDSTDFLVIIDNMMNLDLLFWATAYTGDSTYYDIAVTHANTTIANHFRADNSSYHVLNYDPKSGEVQEKKTAQGLNDESAWARGQSWGLYGFTATYTATKDERYLDQAIKIADFILNHPNLPEDFIPVWDYNADSSAPRDASAAAIMASGLIDLHAYAPEKGYLVAAKKMIGSLSENYTANLGTNGNFIIEHCVGHLPANSEVNVPLTYADYYFIEALLKLDGKLTSKE
ncbi:MAG: glycoside hydrolase family 88 protein [Marinoscillum sp.]